MREPHLHAAVLGVKRPGVIYIYIAYIFYAHAAHHWVYRFVTCLFIQMLPPAKTYLVLPCNSRTFLSNRRLVLCAKLRL